MFHIFELFPNKIISHSSFNSIYCFIYDTYNLKEICLCFECFYHTLLIFLNQNIFEISLKILMMVFLKLCSPFIVLDFKFNIWVSFYTLSLILETFLILVVCPYLRMTDQKVNWYLNGQSLLLWIHWRVILLVFIFRFWPGQIHIKKKKFLVFFLEYGIVQYTEIFI